MIIIADKFLSLLENNEKVPNVIVAWGEENYYKDAIKNAVEKAVCGDVPESDRSQQVFDGGVDFSALEEAINTYPFFSDKNFIIIREPQILNKEKGNQDKSGENKKNDIKKFADILSTVPEYTYVLCLCGKLDKRLVFYKTVSKFAAIVECSSIRSYSLKPWLDAQAAKYGARFDYKATALIMEYMSVTETVPLLLLQGEIAKLAIYAGKRKIWTDKDVAQIFSSLPEISGFALGNAIREHKLSKVLELLGVEQKNDRNNFIAVLARVSYEIRRLCKIKELTTTGTSKDIITAKLRMHPYAVQLYMQSCQKFSLRRLEKCLTDLNQMNMEMRLGGRQWPLLEEKLVMLLQS
ncbi:MAG: DNA polymerase III subunit delta [Acidaminococcaceae bacterium]|jgi:DNA polymerase-3 subunit delta|nr:DNA polymerase III subunit delta [Acidaminococcaceae bacterium]